MVVSFSWVEQGSLALLYGLADGLSIDGKRKPHCFAGGLLLHQQAPAATGCQKVYPACLSSSKQLARLLELSMLPVR